MKLPPPSHPLAAAVAIARGNRWRPVPWVRRPTFKNKQKPSRIDRSTQRSLLLFCALLIFCVCVCVFHDLAARIAASPSPSVQNSAECACISRVAFGFEATPVVHLRCIVFICVNGPLHEWALGQFVVSAPPSGRPDECTTVPPTPSSKAKPAYR